MRWELIRASLCPAVHARPMWWLCWCRFDVLLQIRLPGNERSQRVTNSHPLLQAIHIMQRRAALLASSRDNFAVLALLTLTSLSCFPAASSLLSSSSYWIWSWLSSWALTMRQGHPVLLGQQNSYLWEQFHWVWLQIIFLFAPLLLNSWLIASACPPGAKRTAGAGQVRNHGDTCFAPEAEATISRRWAGERPLVQSPVSQRQL